MTPRRAKRYINQSNEWIVFADEINKNSDHTYRIIISSEDAWEILLNLAINQYPVRETLRNIIKTADEYIENNRDYGEPE